MYRSASAASGDRHQPPHVALPHRDHRGAHLAEQAVLQIAADVMLPESARSPPVRLRWIALETIDAEMRQRRTNTRISATTNEERAEATSRVASWGSWLAGRPGSGEFVVGARRGHDRIGSEEGAMLSLDAGEKA